MAAALLQRVLLAEPRPLSPYVSGILDLSRWVAACAVVVDHLFLYIAAPKPADAHGAERLILWLGTFGNQAVAWFFVLSGCLVGGSVWDAVRARRFAFGPYLRNRLVRIYLVLIPTLVVSALIDQLSVSLFPGVPGPPGEVFTPSLGSLACDAAFLQHFACEPYGSNRALWSLCYEFWMYLLFPLCLAPLMPRLRPALRMALLTLATLLLLLALRLDPRFILMFLLWILGASVRFVRWPRLPAQAPAWALAFLAVLAFPRLIGINMQLAYLALGLAFTQTLLTAFAAGRERRITLSRLHRGMADFSFSTYVTHSPMLHFCVVLWTSRVGRIPMPDQEPLTWAICALLLAVLYAYAWAFSRLTEAHTERVRRLVAALPAARRLRLGFR